jgi:CheY-like chemotaxis protein
MSVQDIIAALLDLLKVVVSWPVVFFVLAMLFKKELHLLLPELAKRVRKAPGGWEFASEEQALKDAIDQGAKELGDKPSEFADFAKNQVEKLAQSRSVAALVERTSLTGKSILWVDDKPVNNTYEASSFRSMGAKIDMVLSTSEALEALDKGRYDLIISDIRRFEKGVANSDAGYEFLDALIKRDERVPVIFYTATIKTLNKSRTKAAYGVAHRSAELTILVISALSR